MKKGNKILALVSMLVLLLGALVIQSCEKEPPPVVPELKPTLEVSATPQGVLPYGSKITISWTTVNANTLKINDIPQAGDKIIKGQLLFYVLASDPNKVRKVYVRLIQSNKNK